jgi:NAD(P)-dependent dehydrogenase (short-subunit alcohol dehydrogenase family)
MRFAGKTVVITGGAGGLGSAMVRGFAGAGASVAIVDLPGSRGADLAAQVTGDAGSAFFAPCDLADLAATRQLITGIAERHDRVDVLGNTAAI